MSEQDAPVFIYTTFGAMEEAEELGYELVNRKLAACVNIFPGMVSLYEWQGDVERADEVAMIVKTRKARADETVAEIARLHPYDEPAVLVIPLAGGSQPFINWIAAQTAAR